MPENNGSGERLVFLKIPIAEAWLGKTACGDVEDPDIFFKPDYGETTNEKAERERAAVEICMSCEAKIDCLRFAMVNRETGVWGGTNDDDRKVLKYNQRFRKELASTGR